MVFYKWYTVKNKNINKASVWNRGRDDALFWFP